MEIGHEQEDGPGILTLGCRERRLLNALWRRVMADQEDDRKPRGYATGKEMYERLARPGPPLAATLRGLPKRHEPHMSLKEALAARPAPAKKDT